MVQITVLYTGDLHGHVDRLLRAAYLATIQRQELQAAGHHVILLDSGDVEDRALLESDVSKGAAPFRLLKAAEYHASAVGNGAALSYGPQVLRTIALESGLPLLCANMLTHDGNLVPGVRAAMIIPCGSVWLGLIGLTARMNGLYDQFFGVHVADPITVAQQQVRYLRSEGCQIVGVLSHLGYEDDVRLAENVAGIQFIIGGHSHTLLLHPAETRGIPICHAGDYGHYLGRLDLMANDRGRISEWRGRLIEVPDNAPVQAKVEQQWLAIQAETRKELESVIGELTDAVTLASDRACGMGQLLADALRVRMNAEVALCITGHLQDGLPAGPVTLGDLFRACSSPANPAITLVTGAQIVRALEYGADPAVWKQAPRNLRGVQVGLLQASGLTYRINMAAPTGQRVSDVSVMGRPIDLAQTYSLAATDYELSPRRGYFPDLNPKRIRYDVPWVLREVLLDHLAAFNPLTPGLRPRIKIT